LAAKNKKIEVVPEIVVTDPVKERVIERVIVAQGASFKTGISFILFGALLGAGAALYYCLQRDTSTQQDDAVSEGLSAGGAKMESRAKRLLTKTTKLAKRVKDLSVTTAKTTKQAATVWAPAISEAISQGRSAAEETQAHLRGEVKKANEEDTKSKTKKSPLDDLGEEA
jgi:gas vesicle protein